MWIQNQTTPLTALGEFLRFFVSSYAIARSVVLLAHLREQPGASLWLFSTPRQAYRPQSQSRIPACLVLPLALCVLLAPDTPIQADPTPTPVAVEPTTLSLEDAKQVELLKAHWQSQRESIFTIRVKQLLVRDADEFRSLGPRDVDQLFDPDEIALNNDNLKSFVNQKLRKSPLPLDPPWREVEFVMSGEKTRETNWYQALVFDGEDVLIRDDDNKHVSIGHGEGTSQRVDSIADFRFLPETSWVDTIESVQTDEGELTVFGKSNRTQTRNWLKVNLMNRMPIKSERFTSGQGVQVIQGAWATCSSEVQWPMVHGVFRYTGDPPTLKMATVRLTTLIEVNVEVPPETFVIASPVGYRITDYRSQAVIDGVAKLAADDVKTAIISQHSRQHEENQPIPNTWLRWKLIIGNVAAILLVIAGVSLRRLYRRKST